MQRVVTGGFPVIDLVGSLLVRALVGSLLTLAGAGKLIAGSQQREKWLRAYDLLPSPFIPAASLAVPSAELIAGAALLLGFGGRLSVAVSGGVLLMITSAAAITLARGTRPDCGCFGRWARDQLSWNIVARNLGLVAVLAVIGTLDLTQPGISTVPLLAQVAIVAAFAMLVVAVPSAAARWFRLRSPISRVSKAATQA